MRRSVAAADADAAPVAPRRRLPDPPTRRARSVLATAQSSRLLALPPDCLRKILEELAPPSLARSAGACRALLAAARDSSLWKARCLLLYPADDFLDGPPVGPARYAARSRLFVGHVVCSTGLATRERDAARAAVEAGGGTWDDDLTSFTTVLVCAKVFGKKAEHARKRLGRVRLVTPSWLAWSLQTVRLATPQQHKVPIFLGVVVTCSGLPHEIRARIGQALEAHGGELAAGFYARRTTHFVCGDISSSHSRDNVDVRKLVEACRLGIPVVRPRWIADCVESGLPLDCRLRPFTFGGLKFTHPVSVNPDGTHVVYEL